MTASKRVLIIAGPNGAGKTVFATEFLPHEADCPIFINADLIAAGVSPFRPGAAAIRAGKIMLGMIQDQVRQGKSFAFETTLSGCGYVRSIPHWKERGYSIKLFFLRLRTPELAIDRVRQRVKEGGHDVPEPVIRRCYEAGWNNFQKIYKNLVDEWAVYDNSGNRPELIAKGKSR